MLSLSLLLLLFIIIIFLCCRCPWRIFYSVYGLFNDLHVFLLCFVEVDIKPTNHHRGLQHNFIYHHKDCGGGGGGWWMWCWGRGGSREAIEKYFTLRSLWFPNHWLLYVVDHQWSNISNKINNYFIHVINCCAQVSALIQLLGGESNISRFLLVLLFLFFF